MSRYVQPMANLIEQLMRLPSIGPKTAQRLAFHILKSPRESVVRLAEALIDAKDKIVPCSVCGNITEQDPCSICTDDQRDKALIAVVEESRDVLYWSGPVSSADVPCLGRCDLTNGRYRPDDISVSELLSV